MLRTIIGAVFGAALALSPHALAQDWPARPVTMVVPFAAGGGLDVAARILGQRMSELAGQQIVIENIGGAGGMIGSNRVARAASDGYTFIFGNSGTHAGNQSLYKKPLYDAATDFAPVILFAELPRILIVRKDFPADTLPEFIAYARANQAKMQFGSGGAGSASHVGALVLNSAIGVTVTHIPYRGTGPALQELIAGRIDYMTEVISTSLPQVRSGAVKAIAVLAPRRAAALPDVGSAAEQGLKDFDVSAWYAFFFPKGTPDAIVRRMNRIVGGTLDTPAVRERLEGLGVSIVMGDRRSPEYLATFVRSEIDKWAAPIKASGISVD